jgi:hypothetical protein
MTPVLIGGEHLRSKGKFRVDDHAIMSEIHNKRYSGGANGEFGLGSMPG